MSWGYKIAIAYGSFVIMILYFLFVASRQTNELVEEHYYEKELRFQDVLTANKNLSTLNIRPLITFEDKQLHVELPSLVSTDVSNGKIECMRLSDKTKDISEDFKIDQSKSFSIPGEKFHSGIYHVKIQWNDRGIPYMYEEQINYPKQ